MIVDPVRFSRYVRDVQYGDGRNFAARLSLHARFGTNRYGLHRWIFDRFALPADVCILEIGCGLGFLWSLNADRIVAGWRLVLTDFSRGMLTSTRAQLNQAGIPATYLIADAQHIPFADDSFDAVIANHMLYHIPDRDAALREIRRVLASGGRLYASTIGREHLGYLNRLAHESGLDIDLAGAARAFGVENGAEQLAPWFTLLSQETFPNELVITDPQPVMDYVRSTARGRRLTAAELAPFRAALTGEIERDGAIHVGTSTGLFICQADKSATECR